MENNLMKIGLIGIGTVGSGVWQVINKNKDLIEKRAQCQVEIKKVADRDTEKLCEAGVPEHIQSNDAWELINDPDLDIIVELIGGIEPAKTFIIAALKNGKHVVTANKDLIAAHGGELLEVAEANSKNLYFEASVGGGIPIIMPLKESLAGNYIEQIMGIINGTTNYILTKMTNAGSAYEDVLKEAQKLGYAEADPTSDVGGFDSARKIAILASIAFNTRVTDKDVYVEGIQNITAEDIQYAKELGFTVKLLGIAKESDDGVEVRVHPVMIPNTHPLASVNDAFNAIFVRGDAVGDTMFYGRGAGTLPTASAVVGDIVKIVRNRECSSQSSFVGCTCFEQKRIKPIGEIEAKYFIRLSVEDRPGVLANIAAVFGNQSVSLASVIQKRTIENAAELVLITHTVKEQNIQDSLKILGSLSIVSKIANVIRVEGAE